MRADLKQAISLPEASLTLTTASTVPAAIWAAIGGRGGIVNSLDGPKSQL